jgi:hypothetical protein
MSENVTYRTVELDLRSFAEEIAPYTVGFLKRNSVDQPQSLDCVGSGVLVSVGQVYGILTAGHVLANLPSFGQISLITFPQTKNKLQNFSLEMSFTERLVLGGPVWGESGPDIGFLRLANDVIGILKSSNSFRNLRNAAQIDPPLGPKSKQFIDAVLGVVDERTHTAEGEKPGFIIKKFEANFMDGSISTNQTSDDFDYCSFAPRAGDTGSLPTNFGGVSGGGIWRIYYDGRPNEKPFTVEKRLWGICYYQSEFCNGSRTISGHGPDSIYKNLMRKIEDHWPDAKNQSIT